MFAEAIPARRPAGSALSHTAGALGGKHPLKHRFYCFFFTFLSVDW